MTCEACTLHSLNPHAGRYHFACVHCCARLVQNTHPSKPLAAAMLAAIARHPGAPGRAAILACVRRSPAKPP